MAILQMPFGTTKAGEEVKAFTLLSETGATATIMTYGGILTRLLMPDRTGAMGDVTLGFDVLERYETQSPYFGALVGRFCNRIAKGRFTLDGKTYQLATNNGPNHLHGGIKGYDKRIWAAEPGGTGESPSLTLKLKDEAGTEHYPGTVDVTVTYTLNGNTLRIDYVATADAATPINLTNHSYFNLKNGGRSDVLAHVLHVNASHYTPVDATLIPTGEIAAVKGTPIDFTMGKAIGRDLLKMRGEPKGYDHNVVLDAGGGSLTHAATVTEETRGRRVELFTTQPGLQLYTANFLDGTIVGRGGAVYGQHHAFCMETQHFPDSPNRANFPSTILRPGERFAQSTEFRFSTF